jgi:hypothetical protein
MEFALKPFSVHPRKILRVPVITSSVFSAAVAFEALAGQLLHHLTLAPLARFIGVSAVETDANAEASVGLPT